MNHSGHLGLEAKEQNVIAVHGEATLKVVSASVVGYVNDFNVWVNQACVDEGSLSDQTSCGVDEVQILSIIGESRLVQREFHRSHPNTKALHLDPVVGQGNPLEHIEGISGTLDHHHNVAIATHCDHVPARCLRAKESLGAESYSTK